MTRKIFWRDGVGAGAKSSARQSPAQKSPAPRPAKRVKAESHEAEQEIKDLASSLDTKPNARNPKLHKPNPQSSEPIEEIFMADGLSKDDMYRMVEDEFYLTANTFTAHLHRAEYQRLQEEAKSQNALKIRNISRPVVGQATDLVKNKQDRISRLKKQKSARRKNSDSEDDDDDTFRSTTLFGLMESPRKKHPTLDHFIQPAVSIKPFATSKAPPRADPSTSVTARNDAHKQGSVVRRPHSSILYSHGSDDDDEDDLDAEPRSRSTSFAPRTTTVTKTVTAHEAVHSAQPVHSRTKTTPTNPQSAGQRSKQNHTEPQSPSDDDSEDDLFGFQKRAKNRARQKAKSTEANKQNHKSGRDVIPDFI